MPVQKIFWKNLKGRMSESKNFNLLRSLVRAFGLLPEAVDDIIEADVLASAWLWRSRL